jgi:cyclopropane fatty-acyl-phospholipid synthase-like methyltransferase
MAKTPTTTTIQRKTGKIAKTPDWLRDKLANYYRETTESSYLANWAGESLGFHFGLSDESTSSVAESLTNSNRYLADKAKISAGTRVLDAGCGVGGSSIWLARERGATVTGITIAPNQVDLARRFATERQVSDRTSFHSMDYMHLDFPAGSFDVVWNMESMVHSIDPSAYLEHVWNVLAEVGRFACVE